MKKLEWFLNKNLPFKSMKDINEVLPKVPNMKWGALMNKAPTNKKVKELDKIFPYNGKWHTVFEEKDHTYIDGKIVWKKDKVSWT